MFSSVCIRGTYVPLTAFVSSLGARSGLSSSLLSQCRWFARGSTGIGNTGTRIGGAAARRRTLKEVLQAPATDRPFILGRLGLAAGAGVGIGALCYYGLGLSSEAGAFERSMLWPQYVRDRVRDTYGYFGGSLALTAGSAYMISRTPALMNMFMRSGWMALIGTIAAMIGTAMVARAIPYEKGKFGAKQLAWMVHCGVIGGVVAPLTLLGGPILLRAAWYTAGVVAGLSTVAACAPSDKFLYMGGMLGAGLGVVLVASLGSMFVPPSTALGAGMYSVMLYGGLLLFSAFLLHDTQRIVHLAENHPVYAVQSYDPINACMSIYMDTINIFIRIAMILAGGGGRRK